jgi:single-stranded-DNA-specific exonuclease
MTPSQLDVRTPDTIKTPPKTILERQQNPKIRDAYLAAGVSAHLATFLSRRLDAYVDPASVFSSRLSEIPDPIAIPSTNDAVLRIEQAIVEGQRIALVCDHDMDGTGSAAVLWTALVHYFGVPTDRITVITSHRLREGYGITDAVVARIQDSAAKLVITADNGSSDEARITKLSQGGIDVIVSDHHVIPAEGPPASAFAVVNPSRLDAVYDTHVCGAGVAFLLMAKVRTALVNRCYRPAIPSLVGLLDYVAVATIADCVSLSPAASLTNRTFIRRGIELIRCLKRPCWRAFAQSNGVNIDPDVIAFRLAPAIAAAGRLDWAELGFRFLVSSTDEEAARYWAELKQENVERQAIERKIRNLAFEQAAADSAPAVVLFMEDGHAGVHGISASRVVESFGKPCAIFCAKGSGARDNDSPAAATVATGSFRSIPGISVHQALQEVAAAHPDLLLSFGGHRSAAGATIKICDFERFRAAFCTAVARQDQELQIGQPILWTDGELDARFHTPEAVRESERLGPFGRGFEAPTYSGSFRVIAFRSLSDGRHGKLRLQNERLILPAIWFSIDAALDRLPEPGDTVIIAYRLNISTFGGGDSVEATILAGKLLEASSHALRNDSGPTGGE